jgi:hypothetical protein
MTRFVVIPFAFVVVAVASCALTRSQQASSNGTNAEGGRNDQSGAQPPINITVVAPKPSPEDTKRDEDRQDRNVTAQEDIRDFTRMLTILAFVQALITLGALGAAIRAANAAKTSANIARDALHLTERADVVVDSTGTSTAGALRFDTTVTVFFKNTGRTRANDVIFDGALGVPGSPLGRADHGPPTVIAAGDTAPFNFAGALGTHIPPEQLQQVNVGATTLRLDGKLSYSDVFTKPHSIVFQGEWNSEQGAFTIRRYEAN